MKLLSLLSYYYNYPPFTSVSAVIIKTASITISATAKTTDTLLLPQATAALYGSRERSWLFLSFLYCYLDIMKKIISLSRDNKAHFPVITG